MRALFKGRHGSQSEGKKARDLDFRRCRRRDNGNDLTNIIRFPIGRRRGEGVVARRVIQKHPPRGNCPSIDCCQIPRHWISRNADWLGAEKSLLNPARHRETTSHDPPFRIVRFH